MEKIPPQYKDPQGQELFGIPDLNKQLRENTDVVKRNTEVVNSYRKIVKLVGIAFVSVIGFLGLYTLILTTYVLYQIMKWDLFTRFVEALG